MVNPDVVTTRVVPIGQTVAIILNTPASTNTGIPTNGVWVIAGVHGDEPVPPYALFTRWRSFSWQTPTVVIPFANPSTLVAPSRTKRYGLGFDGGVAGNEEFWAGVESVAAQFVVPRLVLDLHEDGDVPRRLGGAYVYHHGNHLELPFNLVELWLGLGGAGCGGGGYPGWGSRWWGVWRGRPAPRRAAPLLPPWLGPRFWSPSRRRRA